MNKNILAGLMILTASFSSCKKTDRSIHLQENDTTGRCGVVACTEVICTAVFTAVLLEVKNAAGTPVTLDSFVVTNLTGTPLPLSGSGSPVFGPVGSGNGMYTIINDAWVQGHQNTSLPVLAKGYINGAEVFNEPFTIAADCCHVRKFSGKSEVTLP